MKINIYPSSEEFGGEYMKRCVAPANQNVAKWYRDSKGYTGDVSDTKFLHKRMTIKKCIPVLDYMTTGLNLYLPFSIHVEGAYPERVVESTTGSHSEGKLSKHHLEQVQKFPLPDTFDPQPFKVDFPYTIETPRGYSSIYVQPVNELYENFLFPRGLVNTDNYHNQVNFPFFIRKDFSGTVEAGTHFMSVFFMKREKLELEYKSYEDGASRLAQTRSMVVNWSRHFYRNNRFNRQ
jgi:hypothetical protein